MERIKLIFKKIRYTLELVKFSHSVFALPFALASLFFAAGGVPPAKTLVLVVLAMVFARNTAMTFNRLTDSAIDSQNPRTAKRHIPTGLLSKKFAVIFILGNAFLFILTTRFINTLSFTLSPLVLAVICFYSLTKRFTNLSQIFLGISLGLAPIGAWIAQTGTINIFPALLGLAVVFWVSGFDIIYATQDFDFDKKAGLKSMVVKFGIGKALLASRLFHTATIAVFCLIGAVYNLNFFYWITIAIVSVFFVYEHSLVRASDLSRVNSAFFNVNGAVGLVFLAGAVLETVY